MRKLFKGIYTIIDRLIILPISRTIYYLQKSLKSSNPVLDKLLNSKRFIIFLSLVFAVTLFVLTDNKVISLMESEAEIISGVPVIVKYNEEAYVVEGVPKTVDITIKGRKSDIYLAKQLGEYEVVLDLTDYTASDSTYKIYFSYSKSIDSLTYKLDPSYVSVMIKNKVSQVTSLSYDLLNIDKLDPKLSVKNVVLNKNEVVVKGSETELEKIATVKALIDLEKETFTEAGTYDMSDIKLVAYDNSGMILDNIEIVPNTISASITLESYSSVVPLKIQTNGNLIAGKAIAAITINNSPEYSLTIYGDKSEIDAITSIPVTIDIDGYGKESSKTYNVVLSKPNGVRQMSAKSVTVTVTFGNEEQKTIEIQDITHRNIKSGLTANLISDKNISVQVKGVSSVINDITAKDISAYVDLEGLTAGEHEVEVKIENNNPMVNYVVSGTVTINIQ